MKFVISSIALLLAACSAPRDSESAQNAAPAPSPAAAVDLPTPINESGAIDSNTLQGLRVVGTEPFWAVKVEGDTLTFTTPENQVGLHMRGKRTEVAGGGVDIAGQDGERTFSLKVRPGECSDGMSDMKFTMTANFQIGETRYRGCAQVAE